MSPPRSPTPTQLLDQPFDLAASLRGCSTADLEAQFAQLRGGPAAAGLLRIFVCGILEERLAAGESLEDLAVRLGVHPSRVSRLTRSWREICVPRLEAEGAGARFPLRAQEWYRVACEESSVLRRSPERLLREVEARHELEPRYSARRWRQELAAGSFEVPPEARAAKVRPAAYPESYVPLERLTPPAPAEPAHLEWAFLSIDGVYRAARGKSEPAIGFHWAEVMEDRELILDGRRMSCEDGWNKLVAEAASDGMALPSNVIFPDIEAQFPHRPEARGAMECLAVAVRVRGGVGGFLFLDFGGDIEAQLRSCRSFRYLRELVRPLFARLQKELNLPVIHQAAG